MRKRCLVLLSIATIALAGEPVLAQQCVPFARMASGVSLRGDAWTWWNAAAGQYDRGQQPREGAVLVFKKHGHMRHGHVAVVAEVLGKRRLLIDHANWAPTRAWRGQVTQKVMVLDVSARNDWTQVRVWNPAIDDLGIKAYPAYGFIYGKDSLAVRLATADAEEAVRLRDQAAAEARHKARATPAAPAAATVEASAEPAAQTAALAAAEAAEARAAEVKAAEAKAAEVRAAEVVAAEARAAEVKAAEAKAAEVRAAEVVAAEARAAEVKAAEAKAAEVRAAEVVAAEARAAEVKAAEAKAAEVRAAEDRATEARAAEAKAVEVKAAELRAAEVVAAEARAAEVKVAEAHTAKAHAATPAVKVAAATAPPSDAELAHAAGSMSYSTTKPVIVTP